MAYDIHVQEHQGADDHHGHHIIPFGLLMKVFGGLVFLTIITVLTATQLDLGVLNVPLALAIAGTKAALVITFFMALKYDNRVNTLVFVVGCIFVCVFLVFTLFDTAFRGDMGNVDTMPLDDRTRIEEELRQRDPGAAGLMISPADFEAAAFDSTMADSVATTAPADSVITEDPADTTDGEQ